MTSKDLLAQLKTQPTQINFQDVMAVIDKEYFYEATDFDNGEAGNAAGTNEGSCKLFAYAQLNQLDQQQTLYLFGQFYQDVLATPEATDHANIRNFMKTGWGGVQFHGEVLTPKS